MKKTLSILLILISFLSYSQDKKISQLPALPSVSGNEQIPLAKSGLNYYTTPTQIKSWLNVPIIDTTKLLHTRGTDNLYPLTRAIEYRGASGGTALVDTTGTMIIGSANRKDIGNLASKYGFISFGNNGSLTQMYNSDNTTESYINLHGFGLGIDMYGDDGANNIRLFLKPTQSYFQSNYSGFKGVQYNSSTCNYVNTNADSTSMLHQGLIKRLISAATSTLSTSTTLTGDVTGVGTSTVNTTLATVNTNTGTIGSASQTYTSTVNGKGLTTARGVTPIQIGESQVTNLVSDLAGKQNTLSGSTSQLLTAGATALVLGTNLSITSGTINVSSPTTTVTTAQLAFGGAGTGTLTSSSNFNTTVATNSVCLAIGGLPNQNPISGDAPHLFEIINDGAATVEQSMSLSTYGITGGGENNIHFNRYRGTIASPTAIMPGDFMMSFGMRGYDGSSLSQSVGAFQYTATETFTPSNHGGHWVFQSVPNGSTVRGVIMTIGGATNGVNLTSSTTYTPTSGLAAMNFDMANPPISGSSRAIYINTTSSKAGAIVLGESSTHETLIQKYNSGAAGNFFGTLPIANTMYFSNGNENASNPMVIQASQTALYTSSDYTKMGIFLGTTGGVRIDAPNNFGGTNFNQFTVVSSTALGSNVAATYKVDVIGGDLGMATLGSGIRLKTVSTSTTSSTQTAGKSTLTGGTVTVTNANVTANSLIYITGTTSGSLTNVGILEVVAGSGSFTVTSTNVLDVSTFNYLIIQPY